MATFNPYPRNKNITSKSIGNYYEAYVIKMFEEYGKINTYQTRPEYFDGDKVIYSGKLHGAPVTYLVCDFSDL